MASGLGHRGHALNKKKHRKPKNAKFVKVLIKHQRLLLETELCFFFFLIKTLILQYFYFKWHSKSFRGWIPKLSVPNRLDQVQTNIIFILGLNWIETAFREKCSLKMKEKSYSLSCSLLGYWDLHGNA